MNDPTDLNRALQEINRLARPRDEALAIKPTVTLAFPHQREAVRQLINNHAGVSMPPPSRVGTMPSPAKNSSGTPEPFVRPNEDNSVTVARALVPVRVANQQVLVGNWHGTALSAHNVIGSMFGGKHFILQLGYMLPVGGNSAFRLVFTVRMPVDKDVDFNDPVARGDAIRTAEAMIHMLNLRREKANAGGSSVPTAGLSGIPGKPLV